jgi:hypothetical protein
VDPFQGVFHDIKLVEVGWTWVRWTGKSKNRASGRPVASVMVKTVQKHQKTRGERRQNHFIVIFHLFFCFEKLIFDVKQLKKS